MSEETKDLVFRSQKYERAGWALLLIALGIYFLLPYWKFPEGSVQLAVGLLLLIYWVIGRTMNFQLTSIYLIAGLVFSTLGAIEFFNLHIRVWPVVLIVVGAGLLWRVITERKPKSLDEGAD